MARTDNIELPVVDLITGRKGSSADQVTIGDLYQAQYNWRTVSLYRLDPDRRKELCSLLTKLTENMAHSSPRTANVDEDEAKAAAVSLLDSDAFSLWKKVAKDPEYLDAIYNSSNT